MPRSPSPKKGFPGQSEGLSWPEALWVLECSGHPFPLSPWERWYLYSTCGRGKGVRNYDCANSQRMFRAPGTCQANPPVAGPQHSMSLLVPRPPPTAMKLLPWPVWGGWLLSQSSSPPNPRNSFLVSAGWGQEAVHPRSERPMPRSERPMGSVGLRSKVVTCSRQRKRNAEPAQAGQTLSQLLLRLLSHEPVHWTIRGFTDVGGQCSAQASLVAGFWTTRLYLCKLLLGPFYWEFY